MGLLTVDLGLLLLSQLLIGQILVPHSSRHSLTGDTEGPVLPVWQGGVDLLAEEEEILLIPSLEVAVQEVPLVPETIKIKLQY